MKQTILTSLLGLCCCGLLMAAEPASSENQTPKTLANEPGSAPRTTLQLAPSHFDDIAWENDRIAYRIYSMKHWQASRPGKSGSGVDVWCKHVREPVVAKLYVNGLYKKDRGLGVDAYDVGAGRGCGGLGIWAKEKLWTSQCYTSFKSLSEGPQRAEFEVTYGPWEANGRKVSEVRKISLELGNNFNRMESRFQVEGDASVPLTVAVGVQMHAGAELEHGDGWVAVWESADGKTNGMLGTAAILPGGRFVQAAGHALLLADLKAGQPLVYYAGAGWSKGLDFPDRQSWVAYTKTMAGKCSPGQGEAVKESAPDCLKLVQFYADALLQHGRNGKLTNLASLVVTCMDVKDFSHLRRDDPQLNILNDAGYRPKDTLFEAADPHLDENFYQILYALSRVTGKESYAQEADRMLAEFFRAGQNPRTGLFAWGEHMGLGLDDGQVQNALWMRGGKWAERFKERPIHEFYRPWVLWPQSFRLDEARCLKFARGLWDYQISEHTGDFSRHAGWEAPNPDPQTGSHFPRHAGFYIAAWAQAYKVSGDKVFLQAIQTQLNFFDRIRDKEQQFVPAIGSGKPVSLQDGYWPGSNLSLAVDLCQNSQLVTPELAVRMRAFAQRELELYLKLDPDKSVVAGWKSGYGDVSKAGTGVMLFMAASACPDEQVSRHLVARGLLYAQAYLDGNPEVAKWLTPGNLGQAILLMIEAASRTNDQKFLAKADWYAGYAAANFLNGTPLPRALKGANFYHAITRGDTLMLALLKLWQVEHRPGLVLQLDYTDR